MATGQDAPCLGSLITRTSWQKYLPPNWAPMPSRLVSSNTCCFEFEIAVPVPRG